MQNTIVRKLFFSLMVSALMLTLCNNLSEFINGILISRYMGEDAVAVDGFISTYYTMASLFSVVFANGATMLYFRIVSDDKRGKEFLSSIVSFALYVSIVVAVLLIIFADSISVAAGANGNAAHLQELTSRYFICLFCGFPAHFITMLLIALLQVLGEKRFVRRICLVILTENIIGYLINVFVVHGGVCGVGITVSAGYALSFVLLLRRFYKSGCRLTLKPHIPFFDFIRAGSMDFAIKTANLIKMCLINTVVVSCTGVVGMFAFSIQNTVEKFFSSYSCACSEVGLKMTASMLEDENPIALRDVMRTHFVISMAGSVLIAFLMIFFSAPFAMLFLGDTDGLPLIQFAIICAAVYVVLFSICEALIRTIQAARQNLLGIILSFLEKTVLPLVMTAYLSWRYQLVGLLISLPASELFSCLIAGIAYLVTTRRKIKGILSPVEDSLMLKRLVISDVPSVREKIGSFLSQYGLCDTLIRRSMLCIAESLSLKRAQAGHSDVYIAKRARELRIIVVHDPIGTRRAESISTAEEKEENLSKMVLKGIAEHYSVTALLPKEYFRIEYE